MRAFLETWKDITGYEGLYQVSDFGDVRSLNYRHTGQVRVLKQRIYKGGYLQVHLCKDGKKKLHLVHRLVATAFIENPDNLPCINHKDEDKTNNIVSNLEYCDHAYNNRYGTRIQRAAEARRNDPKRSKKVLQLTLDGKLVMEWSSTAECGRNGFSRTAISECCNGKRKTHKGYRWVYAEDYYKEAVA